jgi:uncharacterized protein
VNEPEIRVTLDGKDITSKLNPRLISLTLTEKRGGEADQLDLVINDADGRAPFPPEGAIITVALGWKRGSEVQVGLVDKGSFRVDEVQHDGPPDAVTVTARSADFTSDLKNRREKSWHDTTLGTIVSEVAGRHGLKPACAADLASIAVKSKSQSRESDIAFLKRLGREFDAVATIKRGALIFSRVGSGATPSGEALPSLALTRQRGDRHTFKISKREEATGVTAGWHDRKSAKKKTVTVGKEDGAKRLSKTYSSEAEARQAAGAEKSRTARAPRSFSYTLALGRPDIYPEQRATVTGFKAEIDATKWLVSEVRHDFTAGFTTQLTLELAP